MKGLTLLRVPSGLRVTLHGPGGAADLTLVARRYCEDGEDYVDDLLDELGRIVGVYVGQYERARILRHLARRTKPAWWQRFLQGILSGGKTWWK
jgi:hypothetical protein